MTRITNAAGQYLMTRGETGLLPGRSGSVALAGWTDRKIDATMYLDAGHAGQVIAALGLTDAAPEVEQPTRWSPGELAGPKEDWDDQAARTREVVREVDRRNS